MARNKHTDDPDLHGGRLRVPRSRGAFSGGLLILLGVWGALVPLVGPYVDFGYTPDSGFELTRARFWLELLPGVAAAVGGLLLLLAANRLVTSFGAWLAVAGGAWFVIGGTLDRLLHLGPLGAPIHKSTLGSTLETLLLFTGIGALILFLGALAVGRLGVVSVRDVRAAQRRERADTGPHDTDHDSEHDTEHDTDRATVRTAPAPRSTDSSERANQGGAFGEGHETGGSYPASRTQRDDRPDLSGRP